MSERPIDQAARDRFRDESTANFAVSANAGSGKTTAISERLAALALGRDGGEVLRQTAVVTFTKKAAAQIGQRSREVLLRHIAERPSAGLAPLDRLERAFFGTIHSFCLLLAQRHGQALGLNLSPALITDEDDEALWEEFIEQDVMQFEALTPDQIDAFLRHSPLDAIFGLARRLDHATARDLLRRPVALKPPEPPSEILEEIHATKTRAGKGAEALQRNQATATKWRRRFLEEEGYLPIPKPEGKAGGIADLFARYFSPIKSWLADAGAALGAELALRYRVWRFDRGIQTYADQVEAALAILQNEEILEHIRRENWRVILDEAQDTDPKQFSVLVEITRPPGAPLGTWPERGGPGPRAGHFCMVGDGQQAIYGSRADIRNFQRHLAAFARGDGGKLLAFDVTFRSPHRVLQLLNATLPAAFAAAREHNVGLPPVADAPVELLQVPYGELAPGPNNEPGGMGVLMLEAGEAGASGVDSQLASEIRMLATLLKDGGPPAVGARTWGEICLLAPRNAWLLIARKELEAAGIKTALQMRKNRNGDNPVYAWLSGLLAALCDPDNPFEWVGVLREVFVVSDSALAEALRAEKRFHWDDPERYAEPLRSALAALKPFVERVDAEGLTLESFAVDLAAACGLAEKARAADPTGALTRELERLLIGAAELGLDGAGPRAWRRQLLAALDAGRPAGYSGGDAINLLTVHSAKGLEWPVVIPIGLWRAIGKREEAGLRLVSGQQGKTQVFFDGDSIPGTTREARERERLRELVRLLYVALTRARRVLALPWRTGTSAQQGSFADLWGTDLGTIPPLSNLGEGEIAATLSPGATNFAMTPDSFIAFRSLGVVPLPTRLLPHQLARKPDLARTARHESAADEPRFARTGDDPLEYGIWWHETMEFLPWTAEEAAIVAYGARALAAAEVRGFRTRGEEEWRKLLASDAWRELRNERWARLAELSVFAPLKSGVWIDGVIDLVLFDAKAGEVWVVDWKTNRRQSAESDESLVARLAAEYEPQLAAYGACLNGFFPDRVLRLLIFSTVAGVWRETGSVVV